MRKIAVFIVFLTVLLAFASTVQSLEERDYMDRLYFINSQISAVTTDMYACLGWAPDDKEALAAGSKKSISDLDSILEELNELEVPDEFTRIKDLEIRMVNDLKGVYAGIENKDLQAIKPEFLKIGEYQGQIAAELKKVYDKYSRVEDLPEEYDPLQEEVALLRDETDKKEYLEALDLREFGSYTIAYVKFTDLENKYKGTPAEDCIKLRISDCLFMSEGDDPKGVFDDEKNGLDMLSEIINGKKYSPVLFEAFYKWRTMNQYINHGMSNMSQIPNMEYNNKRWEIIQLIRQYSKGHPDDLWAMEQINYLLAMPNIARGGPYGNDNLAHWGVLYGELEEAPQK